MKKENDLTLQNPQSGKLTEPEAAYGAHGASYLKRMFTDLYMIRLLIVLFIMNTLTSFSASAQEKNFHDFTVRTIEGKEFSLAQLKGKKVLVVNVASKCGLTPQYEELQALYEKYGHADFTIIAFPSNNFKEQEPGTNEEIKAFCTLNYGVTFPLMDKIDVTGENKAPVYQWLTQKNQNGKQDAEVTWNFQKFMIDEYGNWDGFATPQTKPGAEEIVSWIEK